MKRMFGTAKVIWATLMLALFDAAGVLVPASRPPKSFVLARDAECYFLCVTGDGFITLVLTYH